MVAREKPRYITVKEYLQRERESDARSEYIDGMIIAMAGASPEHDTVKGNIFGELHSELKGTSCRPFTNDVRVSVPACNAYFYPDTSVVCGNVETEVIAGLKSILNPTLIVEVGSPTTQTFDFGGKWECYQSLESLLTYLIVHVDKPRIEIFSRSPAHKIWEYTSIVGLESVIRLPAIGCELTLADVYARIDFSQPQEPPSVEDV